MNYYWLIAYVVSISILFTICTFRWNVCRIGKRQRKIRMKRVKEGDHSNQHKQQRNSRMISLSYASRECWLRGCQRSECSNHSNPWNDISESFDRCSFRSICGERSTDRIHRIPVCWSTWLGKWRATRESSHQSTHCIYVREGRRS